MLPICRYFLVCMEGHVTNAGERVVVLDAADAGIGLTGQAGGEIVLVNPVHALAPPPGRRYPAIIGSLYLFAQMSGGHGLHRLSIELIRWYQGEQFQVFLTPETPHVFGPDRAAAHVYRVRLAPVIFPVAGQYTFRLVCDRPANVRLGAVIPDEYLIARAEVELLEPR
jgi:hypothetical protein